MLHLFEAMGIELEYMIVRESDLSTQPVSDQLLRNAAKSTDSWPSEIVLQDTGWSNELVMHVIEFKTPKPIIDLAVASSRFATAVQQANRILSKLDEPCMLLGTSAHPFFNPKTDVYLWPHESNEIYESYDRIFGCKGHGWSNLQSMHINLPFADDFEFARLHAAIRIILPFLSSLAASSPFIESKATGYFDTRLQYYATNQSRIPSISGEVIPEAVFSIQEYHDKILQPMYNDIAPFDQANILQNEWLNSRGAIARFDRMAIEIRTLDIQECTVIDIAIAAFVFLAVKALCDERFSSLKQLQSVPTTPLAILLQQSSKTGRHTQVTDPQILECFGRTSPVSIKAILNQIHQTIASDFSIVADSQADTFRNRIQFLIDNGSVAERMLQYTRQDNKNDLTNLYQNLTLCLSENRPLIVHQS